MSPSQSAFSKKGTADGKVCTISVQIAKSDPQKLFDRKICITFYRGGFPFQEEIKSVSGEKPSETAKRAFDSLIKKVKKAFLNEDGINFKDGINFDELESFISSFKGEVLSAL